jgi:hypothetical protein
MSVDAVDTKSVLYSDAASAGVLKYVAKFSRPMKARDSSKTARLSRYASGTTMKTISRKAESTMARPCTHSDPLIARRTRTRRPRANPQA